MGTIQKNAAFLAGAFYALGILVTAIHLSRFAVFDLILTKVTYVLAGAVCVFYLILRFSVAVLIVDYAAIHRVISHAQSVIQQRLSLMMVFRFMNAAVRFSLHGRIFDDSTAESVARALMYLIAFAAVGFVFFAYSSVFDFEEIDLTLQQVADFPPVVAYLLFGQIAYVLWCYFLPVFKPVPLLFRFWMAVFVFLLAADIAFYSLAFHPLVKPSFGGGNVYTVHVPPGTDVIPKTLVGSTSGKMILVHAADDAYYLTASYELDYARPTLREIVQHSDIIRVDREKLPVLKITTQ